MLLIVEGTFTIQFFCVLDKLSDNCGRWYFKGYPLRNAVLEERVALFSVLIDTYNQNCKMLSLSVLGFSIHLVQDTAKVT